MKTTTLYNKHVDLGAKIIDFAGFLLPLQYEGIIKEHIWCRNSCALFDTSHMAKVVFKGTEVVSELGKILTINIGNMEIGRCRYCFILNEKGGVMDDVVIYRLSLDKYMVVSNASTKDKIKDWYRQKIKNTEIIDADDFLDKIDVQGPLSLDVLQDVLNADFSILSSYRFSIFNILGEDNIVSYSGYTGGKGYEIYVNKEKTKSLWDMLLQDERVKPAGLGARDSLRLEAGLPLYGNELDEETTPFDAGMGRLVDPSHSFIGKEALEQGGKRKSIVYLVSETRQSPRHLYKILADNEDIGYVTSGCFSPVLQRGIGIGYIKQGIAVPEKAVVSKDVQGYVRIACNVVPRKELIRMAGIKR
ncbi:MAG: glycine cleavage system aminomethyltransferase GcvT [Elusimicrobia bacterium]|nr:glycine cleavage system aminomethyltransferase GcvT [Elusimicrobiota bacterium]